MKIRMTDTLATPVTTFKSGVEYDVDETEARKWIAGGIAIASDATESTPIKPGEQAVPVVDGQISVPPGAESAARTQLDAVTGLPIESNATTTAAAGLTTANVLPTTATAGNVALDISTPGEPELYGRLLGEWANMSDDEIMDQPNIGRQKLQNIRTAITQYVSGQPAPTGSGDDNAGEQASQTAPAPTNN